MGGLQLSPTGGSSVGSGKTGRRPAFASVGSVGDEVPEGVATRATPFASLQAGLLSTQRDDSDRSLPTSPGGSPSKADGHGPDFRGLPAVNEDDDDRLLDAVAAEGGAVARDNSHASSATVSAESSDTTEQTNHARAGSNKIGSPRLAFLGDTEFDRMLASSDRATADPRLDEDPLADNTNDGDEDDLQLPESTVRGEVPTDANGNVLHADSMPFDAVAPLGREAA